MGDGEIVLGDRGERGGEGEREVGRQREGRQGERDREKRERERKRGE